MVYEDNFSLFSMYYCWVDMRLFLWLLNRSIVHPPDDTHVNVELWSNDTDRKKTKKLERNLPIVTLPPTGTDLSENLDG
jgi:hypothetical protein